MREMALVPKSARSTGVQSARPGSSAVGRHSDARKRLHGWVAVQTKVAVGRVEWR